MQTEIRIVIADDHPIFRRGLRNLIESDPRLKIVGEAEDGETALQQIRASRPQLAILDVAMPGKDGFEVIRAVREEGLGTTVIFLTMHQDERFFNAAMDRGAKGYVLKDGAVNDILASIKAVAAGQNFISPVLSTYLLNRNARTASLVARKPSLNNLTETERRVLQWIAANQTSKEIAEALHISIRTVEKHRANICQKLELRGSHALLSFALEHKSELS
ncbi:MAG: response regulator transcription factor [Acidobacteriota bacterium]